MQQVTITAINPAEKVGLKRFVALERELLQQHPQFAAEIDEDNEKLLGKKSLPFRDMDLCLFIASKEGRDIARCAAIINPKFQREKAPGAGFIGFFAAAPDCTDEVNEMIAKAEQWLTDRGVTRVIAPANGGAPQSMGFLATGFDESPMFPFPWHPPYYRAYLENLAYKPTYPLWYYVIDFSSDKYQEAKKRYSQIGAARIRPIDKKHWDRDIETLARLLNETFIHEWEFTTVEPAMLKEFFGPMKAILEPQQILFAEMDGRPVGFCFAMPDLTPLFRGFQGKVGIWQIIQIMLRAKKYTRGGILGIGVTEASRGKGISKALAIKLYSFYESKGHRSGLYYPVNESNAYSRGFAESIGGKGRMMYQVYDKALR